MRRLTDTEVQLPSADECLTSQAELAICRTLGTDSCNRELVAEALAMHPRTLQRHLQKEGQTFDRIHDRVRRDRAEYYLSRTTLPLAQVAAVIGYKEQSVLTRSCRRWFNLTPKQLRREHPQSR